MGKKSGFTLIEVIVAVMIVSVVVAALLQIQANTTHTFSHLKAIQKNLGYASLLQGSKYGFENDSLTLDRLVERFDLDDDLRRELKKIKAEVIYQRLETIDTSSFDKPNEETQEEQESDENPLVIEIGRTVLRLPSGSASIIRVSTP